MQPQKFCTNSGNIKACHLYACICKIVIIVPKTAECRDPNLGKTNTYLVHPMYFTILSGEYQSSTITKGSANVLFIMKCACPMNHLLA